MTPISYQHVQQLDEYIFSLATCAVSLESIYKLQQHALKDTYLTIEEREQATTIAYETAKAFRAISDMVTLLAEKTEIKAKEVAKRLEGRANRKEDDNFIDDHDVFTTRPDKKRRKKTKSKSTSSRKK